MKFLLFILMMCFCCANVHANDSIAVKKDPRLDVLTAKQAAINKKLSMTTSSGLYKGYRLQVISTRNRDDAFRVKSELLQNFPDQRVYAIFQSPNFKIRIGNFINREEAEKFRDILLKSYPQGVYVVEDAIEYSPNSPDQTTEQGPIER